MPMGMGALSFPNGDAFIGTARELLGRATGRPGQEHRKPCILLPYDGEGKIIACLVGEDCGRVNAIKY